MHNHHVVPRSLGGTRTVSLCGACHGKVHGHAGLLHISRLTISALAVKKGRGERTGSVPYGYALAADGIHLEIDPGEARAVALVRALRAEGLTLRAIGERLAAEGLRPRGGDRWHPDTIARIAAVAASSNCTPKP